jgi:hypothetical protein
MSTVELIQRTQQIIVSPADNSVTIVSAGPVGPMGATGPTGIVTSATAPSNTDVLWVDTTTSGIVFETALRSSVSGGYSYIGAAVLNSADSSSVWKVTRVSLSSPITTGIAYNIAWTNRLTATYT